MCLHGSHREQTQTWLGHMHTHTQGNQLLWIICDKVLGLNGMKPSMLQT